MTARIERHRNWWSSQYLLSHSMRDYKQAHGSRQEVLIRSDQTTTPEESTLNESNGNWK